MLGRPGTDLPRIHHAETGGVIHDRGAAEIRRDQDFLDAVVVGRGVRARGGGETGGQNQGGFAAAGRKRPFERGSKHGEPPRIVDRQGDPVCAFWEVLERSTYPYAGINRIRFKGFIRMDISGRKATPKVVAAGEQARARF